MEKPAETVVMNGGARATGHLAPLSSVLGLQGPPSCHRPDKPSPPLPGTLSKPWCSVDMDMDMDPALSRHNGPRTETRAQHWPAVGPFNPFTSESLSLAPYGPLSPLSGVRELAGVGWQSGSQGWAEAPADTWLAREDSDSNFTEPGVSRISSKRAVLSSELVEIYLINVLMRQI